jgi:hypothetical protein
MTFFKLDSGTRRHQPVGFAALLCICTLAPFYSNCSHNDMGSSVNDAGQSDAGQGGDTRPTTCSVPPVSITHSTGYVASASNKVFVDTNQFPLAICNDGSPALFSIRPGFGAAQNRWVIFLDGGGSCLDATTCTARATDTPDLISSKTYQTNSFDTNFGVISPDPTRNPDLYDATVVRIHYCSSDGWTGNKAGDPNKPGVIPDSWHWRGHEIIKAVVQTLKAHYNFNQANELMFVGSSAGGTGVFTNLGWLSQNIQSSTRLVAATDAGFLNEVAGYDASQSNGVSTAPGTPYDAVHPIQLSLWGSTGDIFCEMKAATQEDHIHCGIGPLLVAKDTGWVRVPMFIRQSLADGVQLKQEGLDLQSNPPKQQSQGYQLFFAQQMRNAMANANNFVTVFAGLDNIHGEMDSDLYWQKSYTFGTSPNQVTMPIAQALGIWYKAPCQLNQWVQ